MIIKIIGAVLVVCGCGGVGFHLASSYRKEEKSLRHLIDILKFMECELKFHLTALPVLCKQVATEYQSEIGNIFLKLSEELEMQTSPKPEVCKKAMLLTLQLTAMLLTSVGISSFPPLRVIQVLPLLIVGSMMSNGIPATS